MITPKRTIHANVTIVRERRLPISGDAFVKPGDVVGYDKCILATQIKGEIQIIRLSEKLGIDPEMVHSGLVVKVGDVIKEGDLIFKKKGYFSFLDLEETAPCTGQIEFISPTNGHIGVRLSPKRIEVQAFVPGEIIELQDNRTALIQSNVGLLQGVVGYGGEGVGKVHFVNSEAKLDSEMFKSKSFSEPTIIAGGSSFSETFFDWACRENIVGIVTSSIESNDVKEILKTSALGVKPPYFHGNPIIVIIEGFGDIPLTPRALQFLKNSHGKLASINGLTQVRAGAIRPELMVHDADLGEENISEMLTSSPKIGDLMRVVRGEYFGQVGEILDIPTQIKQLDSGVCTHTAILKLESGEASVSLANLESL